MTVAQAFEFDAVPPIGQVVMSNGQHHELVRAEPHTRLDGQATTLLVWRTRCAVCAELFEWRSPISTKGPSRRCLEHRQPGIRVAKPKGGRRTRSATAFRESLT